MTAEARRRRRDKFGCLHSIRVVEIRMQRGYMRFVSREVIETSRRLWLESRLTRRQAEWGD